MDNLCAYCVDSPILYTRKKAITCFFTCLQIGPGESFCSTRKYRFRYPSLPRGAFGRRAPPGVAEAMQDRNRGSKGWFAPAGRSRGSGVSGATAPVRGSARIPDARTGTMIGSQEPLAAGREVRIDLPPTFLRSRGHPKGYWFRRAPPRGGCGSGRTAWALPARTARYRAGTTPLPTKATSPAGEGNFTGGCREAAQGLAGATRRCRRGAGENPARWQAETRPRQGSE